MYEQVKASLQIPEPLRHSEELKTHKESLLRFMSQTGFTQMSPQQQQEYLAREVDHFSKKVQLCLEK